MLLEFSISNYRSIQKTIRLSLVADKRLKEGYLLDIPNEHQQALPIAAIYGPNGSGKSNILSGIKTFDHMIHRSNSLNPTQKLPYDPYVGDDLSPTGFEIIFIWNDVRYRYGFSYNRTSIATEYLMKKKIGREVQLFAREGDQINCSSAFRGASNWIEATGDNALFLAKCGANGVLIAKEIFLYLATFNCFDGGQQDDDNSTSVTLMQLDKILNDQIIDFVRKTDPTIKNILLTKIENDDAEFDLVKKGWQDESLNNANIYSLKYEANYKTINDEKEVKHLDFNRSASAGTQKAFYLAGPIFHTLQNGGTIFIDELDAKLHPLITRYITDLFSSPITNSKKAQLIFATHETAILKRTGLRRDQIWFVDKTSNNTTTLYALSDFKYSKSDPDGLNSNSFFAVEDRYLEGRYGAIPETTGPWQNRAENLLQQSELTSAE